MSDEEILNEAEEVKQPEETPVVDEIIEVDSAGVDANEDSINLEDAKPTKVEPTFTEETPQFKPVVKSREFVGGLPTTRTTLKDRLERLKSLMNILRDKVDANEVTRADARQVVGALEHLSSEIEDSVFANNEFNNFFDREGAELVQEVSSAGGVKLGISAPKINVGKDVTRISGDGALDYISARSGTGTPRGTPLYASGLRLQLNSFSEVKLVTLNEVLRQQKLELGFESKGASYSGDDVYLIAIITDFLLENVRKTSVDIAGNSDTTLGDLIKVTDIPALLTLGLATIYPTGYPVYRQCTHKDCGHVIEAERDELGLYKPTSMLDFSTVAITNKALLTEDDIAFMAKPMNTPHSVKEVLDYQARLTERIERQTKPFTFTLDSGDEVTIKFKVPSIAEYYDKAGSWAGEIASMVDLALETDTSLSEELRTKQRSALIEEHVMALSCQRHLHWIKSIHIKGEDDISREVIGEETIKKVLALWSRLDKFPEELEKSVLEYKELMTITYTGIVNYACPACNRSQAPEWSPYHSLIPLNMVSYFFTRMGWRKHSRNLPLR